MKSVLGLIGVTVLSVACSSNGNVLFDDPPGQGGSGASSGASNAGSGGNGTSGNGNGGSANGGKNQGGSNGNSGNAGTDTNGGTDPMGGEGPGPGPEPIYVATTGTDSADCGLTKEAACKSISQGVARGVEAKRAQVYVQAGAYPGVVVLKAGIGVLGGFDNNWQAGAYTDEAHQVVIQGGVEPGSKEYVAVWAHDLADAASLENLVVAGPDAEGQKEGTRDGRSSYGIHAVSAKLSLKDVAIQAGKGAAGSDGANGQDAVATTATAGMNGSVGANGVSVAATCSLETSEGGPAGTNTCASSPSNVDMTGGKGGHGGSRDQQCTPENQPWNWDYTAQPGADGENAATQSGQAGKGGTHGSGGGPMFPQNPAACGVTGSGSPGLVDNGAGGTKAAAGGAISSGFWYALPGHDGATGKNGGGGGGGGGSGGCDINLGGTSDARGGGGGGGGAGGCAARGGGFGGGGGGGSFGIFAVGSTLVVSGVAITRGSGGDGGKGGLGGQGQSGGAGQSGGLHPGTNTPGAGGNGGHGGHGGGGAGGNGGDAYGVVLSSGAMLNGMLTATGGAAGKGGAGGAAAPNAPDTERDGNDGEAGNAGKVGESVNL